MFQTQSLGVTQRCRAMLRGKRQEGPSRWMGCVGNAWGQTLPKLQRLRGNGRFVRGQTLRTPRTPREITAAPRLPLTSREITAAPRLPRTSREIHPPALRATPLKEGADDRGQPQRGRQKKRAAPRGGPWPLAAAWRPRWARRVFDPPRRGDYGFSVTSAGPLSKPKRKNEFVTPLGSVMTAVPVLYSPSTGASSVTLAALFAEVIFSPSSAVL